jgi:hypothetical protein
MYISAASRLPPPVLHVDSIKTDPSRAGVTAANERQINLDHTLSRGALMHACMYTCTVQDVPLILVHTRTAV